MALAFWRDKQATTDKRNGSSSRSRGDGGRPDADDPAATLRVRARRRLIGAAALLLAAAIVVPLLLDPTPRQPVDNIPIDIPSEKQPFTPRISLPPVPDPGQTPIVPPPDLPAEPEKARTEPGTVKEPSKAEAGKAAPSKPASEAKPASKEMPATKAPETKAPETKAPEAKAKASKIVLQAAALSTDAAAQDLSDRLRKAGFVPFTEKVDTADGVRFRVRVGPYATRDEAQRAQSRLRALGVSATLVTT
jgi:DedD protein